MSAAVIRNAKDALEAQASQPAMVNLGPLLTLLTMLRYRPRRNRIPWQELSLPPRMCARRTLCVAVSV